jgi:hypothetical protein
METTGRDRRVPFNVADAIEAHYDQPHEPQSIHLELHLTDTRLDQARLAAAWRSAVAPHPFARARPVNDWGGPAWVIRAPGEAPPLVTEATGSLDRVRADLVNGRVDLSRSALHVVRCRHDRGDAVVVAVNHSAMDGVSALNLLRAASLAYTGHGEEPRGPDALDVHDLRFARQSRPSLTGLPTAPVRIRRGAEARPGAVGYEVCLRTASAPTKSTGTRATVNDLLLATIHWAIARWNGDGDRLGRGDIAVMMPVNLRPAEWRDDVVANLSQMATVRSTSRNRRSADRLVETVVHQTTRIKRDGTYRAMVALPSAVQRNARWIARLAGDRFRDTAILSNLGRIDAPSFGADRAEFWFSPPTSMPTGLAVGAVTVGDRLHLGFRSRRCVLTGDDLERFADGFLDALHDVTHSTGP